MRRLAQLLVGAALALTLGAGVLGPSQAGAALYNKCPDGTTNMWYVHSYAGPGETMHCVVSGNHVVIDWFIGATYMGAVYDAWHPGNLHWTVFAASGSSRSRAVFCSNSSSLTLSGGPVGWNHQINPGSGVVNHFHNLSGKPYSFEETAFAASCIPVSGGGTGYWFDDTP